jgi:divalent metal cation (Fe/Co/Zn/Cd) transporter
VELGGGASDDDRAGLVTSALRLSYFTIVWNGATGAVALVVALLTDSLALTGFALSALLDTSASVVLVWRFIQERRDPVAGERLERRAQAFIAVAMSLVALYVGFEAVRALVDASHADESRLGIPRGPPTGGVLTGDGVLTLAAAALAAITLVALALASGLDWWWADPVAALVIAAALLVEATRIALHHRFG